MWQLQERLDFTFMFLSDNVLITPLDEFVISSDSIVMLGPSFPIFQVPHRVVILIFC